MKAELTYKDIMSELESGNYRPIYYLMGDEPFFIDRISDYIENNAIPEDQRDFNQLVVYGLDTTMKTVVERARAYPMMGDRQVIIVKEAQHLAKETDFLAAYLTHPQPSTVLVFCHKNGTLDKRKKVASDIAAQGLLFTSKKIDERGAQAFASDYVASKGFSIDDKGCTMIVESVGADLTRMVQELDKLMVSLKGTKYITPEDIEKLVGVSKDYNMFEFRDALVNKNIFKANQIATYYEHNSKTYPIQLVTAVMFSYFANLMLAYYSPDKTERGVAAYLGLKNPWAAKDYITGMKKYNAFKVLDIISDIRYTDARSKGVGASGNTDDGLLRELTFRILH